MPADSIQHSSAIRVMKNSIIWARRYSRRVLFLGPNLPVRLGSCVEEQAPLFAPLLLDTMAEQPQLSEPVLIGGVFHPSDHFCGPPLDPLQQVHVLPVLRAPELDAVLQVRSHQTRVEGQNPLPRPAGHASFDAAQDTVGFLGCECTLPAHVQLFIHQYPQVLLGRAALNPFIPQPVLIPEVAQIHVQDLALGLVEPHEVHMGPLLELVQVSPDGIPSLRHVNHTTQLGGVCKLAEGAINPTVYVTDEDVKLHWSQHRPLRDTTSVKILSTKCSWELKFPLPSPDPQKPRIEGIQPES
ncbi:hypothetical protein QYF61_001362 [Mycteria americana]|uniref:Uncharacterized protein n=1 Tax=Mycteria americana TaxID=33587 RepID=A0AAN7RPW3_MYCAM|nr:hypothetical protein QYF61_001362 [Mycteria americana]